LEAELNQGTIFPGFGAGNLQMWLRHYVPSSLHFIYVVAVRWSQV
jgi:hypothetical protein